MAAGLRIFCLCAVLSLALCDTYMHNPRGSNNRLNEKSANRRNANRLFNSQVSKVATPKFGTSLYVLYDYVGWQLAKYHKICLYRLPLQNNNRGGYNAGDKDTGEFQNEDEIYYMVRSHHTNPLC